MTWSNRPVHPSVRGERLDRGVRMLKALRKSLESQPQSVQKVCTNCKRPFTTTNAAQHECEVCVPNERAAA